MVPNFWELCVHNAPTRAGFLCLRLDRIGPSVTSSLHGFNRAIGRDRAQAKRSKYGVTGGPGVARRGESN